MMDRTPLPAAGAGRYDASRRAGDGLRRRGRRRHPAARSRVVAGLLSAVLFLGLGAGMATNQAAVTDTASSASSAASGAGSGGSSDTGSGSRSWAATAGSSSGQAPVTSSQGS